MVNDLTLLRIVQKVLSSLDGDEVNSITDTQESYNLAELAEDVYYNVISNIDLPSMRKPIKLTALSDEDFPTYLKLPKGIHHVDSIQYLIDDTDSKLNYRELSYLNPLEFFRQSQGNVDTTNVQIVKERSSDAKFIIATDRDPSYWTTFDDEYIVLDSLDKSKDTTIQSNKTVAFVMERPQFILEDSFVPKIPFDMIPLYLNELKSWAYLEMRKERHGKAEQQARKQLVRRQNNDTSRFHIRREYPDYGRKR